MRRATVLTMIGLSIFQVTTARDLGTHGATFPIEEQDLRVVIQERLSRLLDDEIDKHFTTLTDRAKLPDPVPGIGESSVYRTFTYDPTITLAEDIIDHNGNVLFKVGTTINPLDSIALSDILFFDANNENHVAWAKASENEADWILVKGNPFVLEIDENHPVYFDQDGVLTNRLGIHNVPARVSQDGLRLKIEEIVAKGNL